MKPPRLPLVALVALVWGASGCSFHRTVVNDSVRDLDASFIELGATTWHDVIRELGPPDPEIRQLRQLTYTSVDRRMCRFRLGTIVYFPFEWYDEQRVDRLMIELDANGVVSGVYRSSRDVTRPPLQSRRDREEGTSQIQVFEGWGTDE